MVRMKTQVLVEQAVALAPLRGTALLQAIGRRLGREPRCPVARYVLGCLALDGSDPGAAARQMMIAYHADARLSSAALLAFTGLAWVSRPGLPLLHVLLETWEEYRRPTIDRTRAERALLDAFRVAEPAGLRDDVLARRLWRLPIRALRAQLADAVAARSAEVWSILSLPA